MYSVIQSVFSKFNCLLHTHTYAKCSCECTLYSVQHVPYKSSYKFWSLNLGCDIRIWSHHDDGSMRHGFSIRLTQSIGNGFIIENLEKIRKHLWLMCGNWANIQQEYIQLNLTDLLLRISFFFYLCLRLFWYSETNLVNGNCPICISKFAKPKSSVEMIYSL